MQPDRLCQASRQEWIAALECNAKIDLRSLLSASCDNDVDRRYIELDGPHQVSIERCVHAENEAPHLVRSARLPSDGPNHPRPVHRFRKVFFCLTGPYLTRRATIGRLANPPLAGGGSSLGLQPPYERAAAAAGWEFTLPFLPLKLNSTISVSFYFLLGTRSPGSKDRTENIIISSIDEPDEPDEPDHLPKRVVQTPA